MNIVCVICSDLLVPSDDVFYTPCGHIFHFVCLTQWLERSKSCPQCREKTTSNKIHRIYFNFSNNDTIIEDKCSLQDKVDKLSFQMLLKEKDIKLYLEKCEKLEKTNLGLMKEVRKVESELGEKNSVIYAFKEQAKYLKQQNSEVESTKKQIEELQKKIQTYKNIETLLEASIEDVDDLISRTSNPNTLITYISVMKREMTISLNKRKELRSKVKGLQQELSKVSMERNFLSEEHTKRKKLEEDLVICETEKVQLQSKIIKLKQNLSLMNKSNNINSKRDNVCKENEAANVVNCIEEEKKNKAGETEVQSTVATITENEENSIYLPVKSFGLSAFKQQSSNQRYPVTKIHSSILTKKSRIDQIREAKKKVGINVITYDGFGGHSKHEKFPNKRQKLDIHDRQTLS